ncbi:MAG: IS3 family transposase [Aggregatibacter sp.]|uniref:IS3 family transposase n=1 Tax=Aggregatibacter sp. TaxID=1872413 RepID=UPI003619B934
MTALLVDRHKRGRLRHRGGYHSIAELQAEIEEYLVYYNQRRIKLALIRLWL